MNELIPINSIADIPSYLKATPIGLLLEYHNLNRKFDTYDSAELLVGMCMDNRKDLNIPKNFSFILRAGGAHFQHNAFHISYAIGVGNIRHFVLIAHSQCGMVGVEARKDAYVNGLIKNSGWTAQRAEEQFLQLAPEFGIDNETEFTLSEVKKFREIYTEITIAPLYYKVEDNRLYLINE